MNNSLKHSEEFIRKKVGINNGFSIPENYFDGIENEVFSSISENSLPKNTNFDVPKDYFSSLEDTILAKVSSEEKEVKVISLRKRILRFAPVAAAASVLLFIGLNFFNTKTTSEIDLSTEELNAWFDASAESINTEELAMVFEATDFEEDELLDTTLEDSSLEEYLNSIDDSSLLNEIQ